MGVVAGFLYWLFYMIGQKSNEAVLLFLARYLL